MDTKSADVAKPAYTEIPVLDVGPYFAGEAGALEALAAKVRHIQENIGFWMMINHGLDLAALERVYEGMKAFFALPMETKLKYRINDLSLGYIPPKSTIYVSSRINKNTKKDLNETLTTALERPADHPWVVERTRFVGPNQWPEEVEGLREAVGGYQQEVLAVARKLLPVYAVALEQRPDYFDGMFTDPVMWSRNAHYPAVEAEDNQFGIAPHCDHSFMTILPISEVTGLQVLTPEQSWLEAAYVEGGVLVNTGEFLNRWTNGRFMATPHRVVPPLKDRYSVATFVNPNPDTLAVPLDSCVAPGAKPEYEPMTMMDYVSWYIDTNYKRDAGGAQS